MVVQWIYHSIPYQCFFVWAFIPNFGRSLWAPCTLLVLLPSVSFCNFLVSKHFSRNWCAVRRTVVRVHFYPRRFNNDVTVRIDAPFVNLIDSLTCCWKVDIDTVTGRPDLLLSSTVPLSNAFLNFLAKACLFNGGGLSCVKPKITDQKYFFSLAKFLAWWVTWIDQLNNVHSVNSSTKDRKTSKTDDRHLTDREKTWSFWTSLSWPCLLYLNTVITRAIEISPFFTRVNARKENRKEESVV